MKLRFILLPALALLTACGSLPTPQARSALADALASRQQWQPLTVDGGDFPLRAYVPVQPDGGEHLTIYMEGDGLAWINSRQPSADPTPNNPMALRLALAQPDGQAAYLARPCQYLNTTACASRYWTSARFAPELITATNRAVDALKLRAQAHRLTLVGYSGGAAVAALVAARREDVDRLITVAGNLDHAAWTQQLRLSPLTGSANPVDALTELGAIRQWHFAGGRDRIIPPPLLHAFAERFPAAQRPEVVVIDAFDHHCCWAEAWPQLWHQATTSP